MASIAFKTHLGCFGCLSFAPSNTSSSSKPLLLLHQRLRLVFQFRQGKGKHHPQSHFNTAIKLLAAKTGTTNTIPEEQRQRQRQIHAWTPAASTSTKEGWAWAEFAEKVSGEWDGNGADFSKEGEPCELPESVVPEAFREWEVKVFDWQTQCPTLAQPLPHIHFSYKLIRLLPTVGCEADAATRYSILERNTNASMAFAYQSSGCYVAVWRPNQMDQDDRSSTLLELEHCLIDPRDRESRVRIIQEMNVVRGDQQHKMMQLEKIQVFCEKWYGPFRGGDQLGGCATRDSAFASTPALHSSRISGVWHAIRHAFATFQRNHRHSSSHPHEEGMDIKQLVDDETSVPRSCSRDGNSQILLPKQLWCSSNHQQDSGGETCFQVGWLLDEGLAITSSCTFSSNANLEEIAITHEKLQT